MQPQTKAFKIQDLINEGGEFSLRRARSLADELVQEVPGSSAAWFVRGLVYVVKGEFQKALDDFEESRKKDPENFLAWLNGAGMLLHLQEYDKAAEHANHVLLNSNDKVDRAKAQKTLACALVEQFKFNEAQKVYAQLATEGFPLSSRSVPCFALGQTQEGVRILHSSLLDTFDASAVFASSIGASVSVGPVHEVFQVLAFGIVGFLQQGYTTEVILQALDKPPADLQPGTPDYVKWWGDLVQEEGWHEDMKETLYLLSIPGMREKLLEEVDEDELVDASELGW